MEQEVTFRIPFGPLPGPASGILLTPLLYTEKTETRSEKEYENVLGTVCLKGLQNILVCHNFINTTVQLAHVTFSTAMQNEGSVACS
jgi:hypothetical protein